MNLSIKNLLFGNFTLRQTAFKNIFWLSLGEAITLIIRFVFFVFVARSLGVLDYGKFSFALAFIALFSSFSDFGLSGITTREFSQDKERERHYSSILSLKLFLGLGSSILIIIGSFFITHEPLIQKTIIILAFFSLFSGFGEIIFAFFRARKMMQYESIIKISQSVFISCVGITILYFFPSIINLSWAYFFSSLLFLFLLLFIFHSKVLQLKISLDRDIWKKFISMSWPIGLTSIFFVIYANINSIIMGYWGMTKEVGWYNAANKIAALAILPSTIVGKTFFPFLSEAFKNSKETFQKIWNLQTTIRFFFIFPLIAYVLALAPEIVNFIYGSAFVNSIFCLQILIIKSGVVFLMQSLMPVLTASHNQKKLAGITMPTALFDIFLTIVLVNKFSLMGALFSTLITFVLLFLLSLLSVIKFTTIKPFNIPVTSSFIGTIFASTLMYFEIILFKNNNLNMFMAIIIGGVTYIFVFFLYKRLLGQRLSG